MIFELHLSVKSSEIPFEVPIHGRIETNDLVELASKFAILLVQIQRELHEEEIQNLRLDDIPF